MIQLKIPFTYVREKYDEKLGVDITNKKFGSLIALYPTEKRINRNIVWMCVCDCGKRRELTATRLLIGNTQSCGCWKKEKSKESRQKQSHTASLKLASRIVDGKIPCKTCKEPKDVEEFLIGRKLLSGVKRKEVANCKRCVRAKRIASVFHLAPVDEKKIDEFQGNLCGICRRPKSPDKEFSIDHRHKDGLIRGKLCYICNKVLGWFRDNSTRLRAAADYLDNPPATQALGEERFGMAGKTGTKKQRKLIRLERESLKLKVNSAQ